MDPPGERSLDRGVQPHTAISSADGGDVKKRHLPGLKSVEMETSYDMLETLEEELAPGLAMPGVTLVLDGQDPAAFEQLDDWLGYVSKAAIGLDGFDGEDRDALHALRMEVLDRLGVIMFMTRMSYGEVSEALHCPNPNPESWRNLPRLRRSNNALKVIGETVLAAGEGRSDESEAVSARAGLALGAFALRSARGSTVGASRAIVRTQAVEHLRNGELGQAQDDVKAFADSRLRRADHIFGVVVGSKRYSHLAETASTE